MLRCLMVTGVMVGSLAAHAAPRDEFLGWSRDLTAYGFVNVNDGDGGEDAALCRSDRSTPSPSWPKGVPQPERGAACTYSPRDEYENLKPGSQRQDLLRNYLVKPKPAKKGPNGEVVTLRIDGDRGSAIVGTRTFALESEVLLRPSPARISDVWWRSDGGAVAFLVEGAGADLFVFPLDGASVDGPERVAATAANARAMKHYKAKDWASATRELRAAIAHDGAWPMPHYNLACVAALQGDIATTAAELEWLTRSRDPAARARLHKALTDPDFARVRDDEKIRALLRGTPAQANTPTPAIAPPATTNIGSALTRQIGLLPLAWTDQPTATEAGDGNECSEQRTFALTWTGGKLDGNYGDGVTFATPTGSASSADSQCLLALGVAQLIPGAEPQVVAHRTTQVGRGAYVEEIVVWQRRGDKLVEVFVGELVAGKSANNLVFGSDGTIRYRAPDKKREQTQTLRWNAAKKKFTP